MNTKITPTVLRNCQSAIIIAICILFTLTGCNNNGSKNKDAAVAAKDSIAIRTLKGSTITYFSSFISNGMYVMVFELDSTAGAHFEGTPAAREAERLALLSEPTYCYQKDFDGCSMAIAMTDTNDAAAVMKKIASLGCLNGRYMHQDIVNAKWHNN